MPTQLMCQGAVYGKADGQSTDYRWLELTESALAGIDLNRLITSLSLGQENLEEGGYYAWRKLPTGYCAARAYLSSARDAAGRSGIVEKAMLFWAGPAESAEMVPRAALSMFRALEAANFGSQWWETRHSREWENRDFHLHGIEKKIDCAEQEEVDRAAAAIRDHAQEWQDRFRAVAAAIDGPRPAILELPPNSPIPDHRLIVALLEMLPAVSIAGWFPSAVGAADKLGHWDIVVAEQGRIRAREGAPAPNVQAVEDRLQKLFLPHPSNQSLTAGQIRPDFEKEMKKIADSDFKLDIKYLRKSFPRLEPGEIGLLEKTIKSIQEAHKAGQAYVNTLDRHRQQLEFVQALLRNKRLDDEVQRLKNYLMLARAPR